MPQTIAISKADISVHSVQSEPSFFSSIIVFELTHPECRFHVYG